MWGGAYFQGSATIQTARGGASALPIWGGFLSIYAYILYRRTTKFVGNTCGEGHVSWGQPHLPSQDSGVPGLPNFGGSPEFMPTPYNADRRIFSIVTHTGRGVSLGGRPRHCICTNASRGLSETADFLFLFTVQAQLIKANSISYSTHIASIQ